ncbi:MAG TPA: (d)CMP kinase [Candidatus Eubacterium avistercoris]|uniref:Cytidylate kinase n=1 Tax=Candidatus Eubacterium avistercoris TaxID=2838567 RepID=A0A9D2D0P6_9FIRM|nr:(d)CMP kinase [Candidatus Eubacterium avistercoris]
MGYNIAIDGPAGAGKSTIAKMAAKKLDFLYVDTGAMYRAMAYYFMINNIDPEDQEKIAASCPDIRIQLKYEEGTQQIYLNGENVSVQIRREEVGNMASVISAYPQVRGKLTSLQQEIAAEENIIMDGRDIGTCVLPGAQLKIYLTASVHTRAQRRYKELTEKGTACSLEEIEKDIEERDYRDMHREISPLKAAPDAVVLDTSHMDIPQVIEKIMELAKKAGIAGKGL